MENIYNYVFLCVFYVFLCVIMRYLCIIMRYLCKYFQIFQNIFEYCQIFHNIFEYFQIFRIFPNIFEYFIMFVCVLWCFVMFYEYLWRGNAVFRTNYAFYVFLYDLQHHLGGIWEASGRHLGDLGSPGWSEACTLIKVMPLSNGMHF